MRPPCAVAVSRPAPWRSCMSRPRRSVFRRGWGDVHVRAKWSGEFAARCAKIAGEITKPGGPMLEPNAPHRCLFRFLVVLVVIAWAAPAIAGEPNDRRGEPNARRLVRPLPRIGP